MMRRYFYTSGPLMSQWIQKNTMARKLQDSYFRNAILAAKRFNSSTPFSELHQQILQMTINQQNKYANNYHLECIFKHFSTFNKFTKLKNMVIDTSKSNVKDLVDPDKFPIWDLKLTKATYSQLWGWVIGSIRHSLGFQLVVRDSKIEHPQGGRGVKVILSKQRQVIEPGEFIGFVPGTIYQHYNSYRKYRLARLTKYQKSPYHLHFPSGKILQLGDIPLAMYDYDNDKVFQNQESLSKTMVDPSFINPYALGHMINHPPPGQQQNVYFTQMYIQKSFFPSYFYKYIPYVNCYDAKLKHLRVFGIFALKPIKNNQQLFVNYLQNHIYPIDNIPEWYIAPSRYSKDYKYFQKGQYELPTRNYWLWLQQKYTQKNKELYQQYKSQTTYTPGKVLYEDSQQSIRKMNIKSSSNHQNEFR